MFFLSAPSQRQLVEMGILLAVVPLFFAHRLQDWDFVLYSVILLFLSLVFPLIFYPVAYLWFGLAKILGFVTSHIILTLLFFLLITPVGLFRKWMGKDSLQLRSFKKSTESVLRERNEKIGPKHLKSPF